MSRRDKARERAEQERAERERQQRAAREARRAAEREASMRGMAAAEERRATALQTPTVLDEARRLLEHSDVTPGCYDTPAFLALEKRDGAAALEAYGRHVVERPLPAGEVERVRRIVQTFGGAVEEAASPAEIRGQCANVSGALIKILEGHGCWAVGMRGSVRVRFPKSSTYNTTYLRINDPVNEPGLIDGHAWVVCPPFEIVDLTLRSQRWRGDGKQEAYLPAVVASEGAARSSFQADLWAADDAMHLYGRPRPGLAKLWDWWPTRTVHFESGAEATYQAHGITLPDSGLDGHILKIGGMPIAQFYRDVVLPRLRAVEPLTGPSGGSG